MTSYEWIYQIEQQLPFTSTAGQQAAIETVSQFLADASPRVAMILRGSAGTGKTSVAQAIVYAMLTMRQKVALLAPTGRAAKVFSRGKAFTIHRYIYRQDAYMSEKFSLNQNLHTDTLFMVDEASMISTVPAGEDIGRSLLDDLVEYVYSGRNCRLMLIGDTAQLPPIGCEEAPALQTAVIEGYGLQVYSIDLDEVLRQSADSGILTNATMLRHMITHDEMTELPRIHFQGFADISICHGQEIIDQLASSYDHVGMDETIVITRSNKNSNIYNMGIRNQVLWYEDELCSGDQVMIVKNNYFWTAPTPDNEDSPLPSFLANGDHAVVRRVRRCRSFYGFTFADVTLRFPDYDDAELEVTALLDTLHTDAPALTAAQQEILYNKVMEDYADIPQKAERHKRLKEDTYFNALQLKYAYAITCHKAQGGQWAHVYLDQGYMTDDMLSPSYIHWLYTAFTRATKHLYLVNWPETQVI